VDLITYNAVRQALCCLEFHAIADHVIGRHVVLSVIGIILAALTSHLQV
jgi:hypothetical protein